MGSALTTRIAHFGKESLASRKGEKVFKDCLGDGDDRDFEFTLLSFRFTNSSLLRL